MTTLFQRLLDPTAFTTLPARVRKVHEALQTKTYRGQTNIERGTSFLAGILAAATFLPPAGVNIDTDVEIAVIQDGEQWTRNFSGRRMRSRLWASDGLLCERLGLATFGFALSVENGVLFWRVRRVSSLGIPLPAKWFDGVVAREFEEDGRYRFDVRADLPLIGLLVHYRGWLDVD
jgi:Domain of unknown function (DUF4166)